MGCISGHTWQKRLYWFCFSVISLFDQPLTWVSRGVNQIDRATVIELIDVVSNSRRIAARHVSLQDVNGSRINKDINKRVIYIAS